MATFGIKSVLSLVDEFTGPLDRVNKKIGASMKPLRDLNNRMRDLKRAMGFQRVGRALSDVSRSTGRVIGSVRSLAREFVILGGIATGAVLGISISTANAADAAAKTAQKIGVSTQAWTELSYAAEMSGVSSESMKSGMTQLNKVITNAAQGNKNALYWFNGLGVSIHDQNGKLKSADVMFTEVADKLSTFEDGAKKSRIAAELFGKSVGPDLIPLINSGVDGLEDLREEANRLGLTFTDEQGKAANDFSSSLGRIRFALRGLTYSIGNELIPLFPDLFREIETLITSNRELISGKVREWVDKIREALPELKERIREAWAEVTAFGEKISTVVEYFGGWERVLKVVGVAILALKLAPLITSTLALTKAVVGLGLALLTTPIGWIILGMVALAGVVYLVYKNWDSIAKWLVNVWESWKWAAEEVGAFVSDSFGAAWEWIKSNAMAAWNVITDALSKAWDAITSTASSAWSALAGMIKSVFDPVVAYFKECTESIQKVFESLWAGLKSAWDNVTGYISGAIDRIKAAFDEGLVQGLDAILAEINPLPIFVAAFDSVLEYLMGFSLVEAGANIVTSLWDGLKSMWDKVTVWLYEKIQDLTGWMPDWLKNKMGLNFNLSGAGIQPEPDESLASRSPFGPPAGNQGLTSPQEILQRNESIRDARVTVELPNLPPGAKVKTSGDVKTNLEHLLSSDAMYGGMRMVSP